MKWKPSNGWRTLYAGVVVLCCVQLGAANPDAKRLYDDLLSTYNRLIRPVSNNNDTVLVKLGLRLSQLIELVTIIIKCSSLLLCCKSSALHCTRMCLDSLRGRMDE